MVEPGVSTAAARSPEKQQSILDAATKVFAEQGFSNTDVQQVADLAGVGKGTVYRYHGSKEELFLAVADAGMKQLETQLLGSVEGCGDLADFVRRVGASFADYFQQRPEQIEILVQERAAFRRSIPETHLVYRQKNRGLFEEMLRRAIESGQSRTLDVREATNALANVLYGSIVCLEGSPDRLAHTIQVAMEVFLKGVLRPRLADDDDPDR